ncbi:hypothetical protein [Spirosoma daeguense]
MNTDTLPKHKVTSFSAWAMLGIFALSMAGYKFGCLLMALFFAE